MDVQSSLRVYEMNGVNIRNDMDAPKVRIESCRMSDEVTIFVPSDPPTQYIVIASELIKAVNNATND